MVTFMLFIFYHNLKNMFETFKHVVEENLPRTKKKGKK
jgi:hypothetical protein